MLKLPTKKQFTDEGEAVLRTNYTWEIMKRVVRKTPAKFGALLMLTIVLLAVFAPLFTPYGPYDMDLTYRIGSPCSKYILGTDALGRDIWTRLLYGARYSLLLGFTSSLITLVLQIIVGSIAGYFGGVVETVIMRFMDVWSAIPGNLWAILISAVLGSGYFNTILALSIGGLPGGVRMLRAQILAEASKEYVEASETINCSKASIMFKHILPNVISPMIIGFSMGIGGSINAAAGLSYIGLGVAPPLPEWGAMLSDAHTYMMQAPHLIFAPGIAMALVVLAMNLLGDGLRDALDPKLRD